MYTVSDAFLQAVQNNTRNYYWTGTLTTTKGTTCEFGNKDILKGHVLFSKLIKAI